LRRWPPEQRWPSPLEAWAFHLAPIQLNPYPSLQE
jgi:hypothetical protein